MSPGIEAIAHRHKVEFIQVTRAMQQTTAACAARVHTNEDADPLLACEPSGFAAAAALVGVPTEGSEGLRELITRSSASRDTAKRASVLVVNTGLGVMASNELAFLQESVKD